MTSLERIVQLKNSYNPDCGLSYEEWIAERLLILEDFARTVAELAPNTGAILYVERERFAYCESFRMLGREAKKLLPDEYKSIKEWSKKE